MTDRLALRPDLVSCALEDRILPAIEFGLFPNPFLQVNLTTNQFYVPGTSTSSAGIQAGGSLGNGGANTQGMGSNPPGPQWFFIMVGGNASGVSNGSVVGGSLSLYSLASAKYLPTGAMVHTIWNLITPGTSQGQSADSTGGGGSSTAATGSTGTAASASVGGFGATFSSGYGFALGAANNYGMFSSTGATALGSVPVHTYTGGGDLVDPADNQNGTDAGGNGASPNVAPAWGTTPTVVPGFSLQGPSSKLYGNLLGKNPGQMGPQAVGPAAALGTDALPQPQPQTQTQTMP